MVGFKSRGFLYVSISFLLLIKVYQSRAGGAFGTKMSSFPLYLTNATENIYNEGHVKTGIEGRKLLSRKYLVNSKKVETGRTTLNSSKRRIVASEVSRHLKAVITDTTVTDISSAMLKKQQRMSTLFLPWTFYIEQPIIQLYPLTLSLQYYLDRVQARHDLSRDKEMEMYYEIERLMSFCGTSCPASPIRLARSGFYAEDRGRQTRCFSCRAVYSDWDRMDRPVVIHRRISPDCPLITVGDERNIPINSDPVTDTTAHSVYGVTADYPTARDAPDGIDTISYSGLSVPDEHSTATCVPASVSRSAPSTAPAAIAALSGLDISQAVYPQYRDLQSRLDSYQGWEWSHIQNSQVLAGAGFYYAGYRDCVRCFYCGVGLRTWEREDDPWVEHIRWRSSCGYILCMKGEQFIIAALARPNQQFPQSASTVASSMPTTFPFPIDQNTDENDVTNNVQNQTIQGMSPSTSQGRQSTPEATTPISTETSVQEPTQDQTFARSLTGISLEREAQEGIQIKNENVESAGTSIEGPTNNDSANSASQTYDDFQEMNVQRQLEEENQSLRDESTCKVCLDNPSCIVFLPCGHLVTCAECAPALRKCPVCRAVIRGTVRAYMD